MGEEERKGEMESEKGKKWRRKTVHVKQKKRSAE